MFAPVPFMRACARRYGHTFTIRFPGRGDFVLTSDPAAIKRAFTATPEQYAVRDANLILRPLLGDNSLLLLDGERHLRERRLMMPPFHGERMALYGDIIVEATERAIRSLPRGRVVRLHDTMQWITLEVIMRAVFGVRDGQELAHLRDVLARLLHTVANPVSIPLGASGEIRVPWFLSPLKSWVRRFERDKAEADRFLYDDIARLRTASREGRTDVLSMLIDARDEDGKGWSDVELRDEMMTLLVAGHETSATSLCWAFCHILRHPPVLARLRAELDDVVGHGPVGASHLPRLPYLDAVIKETLRLTPILPFVGRKLLEPWNVGGLHLPAGLTLTPCIYLTHHRADLWPDPDAFRPERFLDGRLNPYAWFPFGGGVRRCLGMAFAMFEMRMIVAHTLQNLELALAPDYVPRIHRRSITLAPSGGLPIVAR
jgi:cytochrome P450